MVRKVRLKKGRWRSLPNTKTGQKNAATKKLKNQISRWREML
jgi:hypothetical protein